MEEKNSFIQNLLSKYQDTHLGETEVMNIKSNRRSNNNFNLLVISDEDVCVTDNILCPVNSHCVGIPGPNRGQCVCNPGIKGDFCQCEEF